MAKELNERDAKLVLWLNEAHAKEAELETDLAAHITLTKKPAYKKRLQTHLKETREHKRSVAKRIKQLGGQATAGPAVPGVPKAVGKAAGKAASAVKGQVDAARALVSEQAETHVRNAQNELREEHVEIALYTRIETFATEVGDKDTAQLVKRIRREEERMAKYLTAELTRLVKDVVRADVPRDQRTKPRRRTAGRSRTSSSASRSTASRSTRAASAGSSNARSGSSRSSRSSRSAGSTASGASGSTARSSRSSSSNGNSGTASRSRSSRARTTS